MDKHEAILAMLNERQKLIAQEMIKRGAILKSISNTNIVAVQLKDKKTIFIYSHFESYGYNHKIIFDNKEFVRQILLDGNISVAKGRSFTDFERKQALMFARTLPFPLVITQQNPHLQVKDIVTRNMHEVEFGIQRILQYHESFLITEYFHGYNLLVFITKNNYINVLLQKPYLGIFSEKDGFLYEDVTQNISESIKLVSKKTFECFPKLSYLSINLCVKDIYRLLSEDDYIVNEVYPTIGPNIFFPLNKNNKQKNPSKILVDLLL